MEKNVILRSPNVTIPKIPLLHKFTSHFTEIAISHEVCKKTKLVSTQGQTLDAETSSIIDLQHNAVWANQDPEFL